MVGKNRATYVASWIACYQTFSYSPLQQSYESCFNAISDSFKIVVVFSQQQNHLLCLLIIAKCTIQ